jgi:hypothetical protein
MPSSLLQETPKKKAVWVNYVLNRIKQNKNMMIFIGGSTGSGKSWASMSIAKQIDPTFTADRIVFNGTELMALINSGTLTKGSAIVFEEAGIGMSSKSWQSTTNKMLNYLVQTFRHQNLILILNSPYMDFVDASTRKLFHAEISTMSVNLATQMCKVKPRCISYNSRNKKFYFKMLRFDLGRRRNIPFNTWNVCSPEKNLIKEYNVKKDAFTHKLNIQIQNELQKIEDEGKTPTSTQGELSIAQDEVLGLLKDGMNVHDISEELFVTPENTRKHIIALKKKGYSIKGVRDKENIKKVTHYIVENPK